MENQEVEKKKGSKVYIPLIIVVLVVLISTILWYRNYSKFISTDDALIESDKVTVASKVLGRIASLYAEEGDSVKKGQLLVEIDSAELIAQKAQLMAARNMAVTGKIQQEANLEIEQENIKVQEVNFQRANEDLNRAKVQFEGGVMTRENYEHAQKTLESAKALLEATKARLKVARAGIASSQAAIENNDALIAVKGTDLKNTKLYAPIDGRVGKRWLLPGDIAQPSQSIFTVTNDQKFWVSVYLEETKLKYIHKGQPAKFFVDAFPDATFFGKVYTIGSNTASQFSLIPPTNANGNFTKITQRVQLKISIDSISNEGNQPIKLLSGMSVVVKIIK